MSDVFSRYANRQLAPAEAGEPKDPAAEDNVFARYAKRQTEGTPAPVVRDPGAAESAEYLAKKAASGFVQRPGFPGDIVQLLDVAGKYVGEKTGVPTVPADVALATIGIKPGSLPTGEDILGVAQKIPILGEIFKTEEFEKTYPESGVVKYGGPAAEFGGGSLDPLKVGKYADVGKDVALGALSGLGFGAAEEVQEGAGIAGAIATPLAVMGGPAGARKVVEAGKNRAGKFRIGAEQRVAQELIDSTIDREAAVRNLEDAISDSQDVVGYTPDPIASTKDVGLLSKRGEVAKDQPGIFVPAREQNRIAIEQGLEAVAPTGRYGSIDTVRAEVDAQLSDLTQSVKAQLDQVGEEVDALFLNTEARNRFKEIKKGFDDKVDAYNAKIKKTGTMFPSEGIGEAARKQVDEAATSRFTEPSDALPSQAKSWADDFDLFNKEVASELSAKDLDDMRKIIEGEMRNTRENWTAGSQTKMDRLQALKDSIDNVESSVGETLDVVKQKVDFYRDEVVPRFTKGAGGDVASKRRGESVVRDEDTLSKFFHSKAGAATDAKQMKLIYGDEAESFARGIMRNELGEEFDAKKINRLINKYGNALSEFPEIKKDLEDLRKGAASIDDFIGGQKDVTGQTQPSGVKAVRDPKLADVPELADVQLWEKAPGQRTQIAKSLSEKMKTPEQQEALRRSFYNYLSRGGEVGAESGVRKKNFLASVNANTETMKALGYTDAQIQRLRKFGRIMDAETGLRGDLKFTPKTQGEELAKTLKEDLKQMIYTAAKGFVGKTYALAFGGSKMYNRVATQLAEDAMDEIRRQAFSDPEALKSLLTSGRLPQKMEKAVQEEVNRRVQYIIPTLQQEAENQRDQQSTQPVQ